MNLFKKRHRENEPHDYFIKKIGKDPHVDWALIVSIGFVLCIVLVSVGFMKFKNIESRFEQNITPKNKIDDVIDVKALDKVLLEYDKRSDLRADLLRQYVGPKDPSI